MTTVAEANPVAEALSLQHLQAELQRLDVLIRRQVRRWQLAGQDPGDKFRGLYIADTQAQALAELPFGSNWGQRVTLPPAEAQAFAGAEAQAVQQAARLAAQARQQGCPTRLEQLTTAFGLTPFERDALLLCLAPALDLRYERLYGYLQDDITRKYASISLVLDLLDIAGPERLQRLAAFADTAPLFRYQLLERVLPSSGSVQGPRLGEMLLVEDAVSAWLLGRQETHALLRPCATLLPPVAEAEERLLAGTFWPLLERALPHTPLLVFYGPDGAAQRAAARLVAAHLQRPLLAVALGAIIAAETAPLKALTLALRDARLLGAIPYLEGWDACLHEGHTPAELLAELCAFPSLAIVAGQQPWQAQGMVRERPLLRVETGVPDYLQRQHLWEHFIRPVAPAVPLDLAALAGQFILTTDQIRDAVATAQDLAVQRGAALAAEDLFAAARAHSNPRLSGLARKIVPRYTWQDIILPDDKLAILREIVATVLGRPIVLEVWGVGRKLATSKGVTILFAGPPGTGKTMAAEVIATELGLDLYKIDLSTVVSKYIGETEKNLERIFNEAQSSNAILFFDEADAIFGKRSEVKDAHDRYANIEISYLLQRMEAYDGVTILATNLRANLDEAFTRRLQFAVDFPFPEDEDRLRIWQTLFPPTVPRAPELDFELLARRFKLAGGSIRNIIVSAAFLAAAQGTPVTMELLLHATRRELQKMGRLVNERDLNL